jgi:ferritin-like protein
MGSEAYHESIDRLSPQTIELHRAIESLREELEAIDWYQQRVDATADLELQKVLRHNRNEEIEHAAMVLEWIRRRDRGFAQALRNYLFKEGDITALETMVEGAGQEPEP